MEEDVGWIGELISVTLLVILAPADIGVYGCQNLSPSGFYPPNNRWFD